MNNVLRSFAQLALCGAILGTEASAGTLALDFAIPTTNFTNDFYSLGWSFNVKQAVTVTHLGFYDSLKDDLTEIHDIGIYDPSGTLVVAGTVAPGAPLISWFRVIPVAPTVLLPGYDYRIAVTTGLEQYTWDPYGLVVDPRIQFTGDRYIVSGTLAYPTESTGLSGFFGPTFMIDGGVIPEPSTYLMLGSAIVALAMLRLRK